MGRPVGTFLFRSRCGYILIVGLGGSPIRLSGEAALVPRGAFASLRHLVMAAHRACRAMRSGENIAEDFAYELGICLTGIREISRVRELLSATSDSFALVAVCEEPLECLSHLVVALTAGMSLAEPVPGLDVEDMPHCSDEADALAMERGAMVELDR